MTRLEVGRVAKAHGLRGEVSVVFTTDLTEQRSAAGSVLFGADRTLIVAKARQHHDRFILHFQGVNGREEADELRGVVLTADPIESADDTVFVHDLVGRTMVDQHGDSHGEIVSLLANPASDLLELADGRLVPLAFYKRHNSAEVHVEVPEGLLTPTDTSDPSEKQ